MISYICVSALFVTFAKIACDSNIWGSPSFEKGKQRQRQGKEEKKKNHLRPAFRPGTNNIVPCQVGRRTRNVHIHAVDEECWNPLCSDHVGTIA